MKTFRPYFNGFRPATLLVLGSFCFFGLQACKFGDKQVPSDFPTKIEKENVVEIITNHMDFQMPDTIKSGWNTFLYRNLSTQTHFFLIDKYPDGKTLEDAKTFVVPYFENGMKLIHLDTLVGEDEIGEPATPLSIRWTIGLLNITAAAGQIFIFFTIQIFSPLMCTTITTTRKFLTILLSVRNFGHRFTSFQWLSIVMVFGGLYLAIVSKFSKIKSGKMTNPDKKKI